MPNRFAGATTGFRLTTRLDPKDYTKLLAKTGRMQVNIPRYSNRTGRIIAERGRDVARQRVKEQESSFDWLNKGQLAKSIVVRNVEQSNERNIFELAATAPHAWQVENGLIVRRNVPIGETPKLRSWAEGAALARGEEDAFGGFPRGVMNIGGKNATPWAKTGMKYMEAAGNSMKSELRTHIEKLGKEIINS